MNKRPIFSVLSTAIATLCYGGHAFGIASEAYAKGQVSVKSVQVVRVSDGKVLYSHQPKKLLVPASLSKLTVAAAALDQFGPMYTFPTAIYTLGKLDRKGIIHGNLYIKGAGDPFLVSEKLWQMAADLKHKGVRKVTGSVVIDNSLFLDSPRDSSRKSGTYASSHAYDAPISALAINFNTYAVAISAGHGVGKDALAAFDPYPLEQVRLANNLKTAYGNQPLRVQVTRLNDASDEVLMVSGIIPKSDEVRKVYRSVGNHVAASGASIKAFLQGMDIKVQGGVRAGGVPEKARLLYTFDGYPLKKSIDGLNKYSNNFIADMLLKNLGTAHSKQAKGSFVNGISVLTNFLVKKVKLEPTFVLANASGLDSSNKFHAAHVTKLLRYAARRYDIFPELLNSLPSAGVDGTLKKRFTHRRYQKLVGRLRAKTGTLTQPITVVTLAGYSYHQKHGLVAFAHMENGIPGRPQPTVGMLRLEQERAIMRLLANI